MFWSNKWNPDGLHVYVTGGSQGMGLEVAIQLAKKGAHVSIVARNKEKLDAALVKLEAARQTTDQKFHAYSFSLESASESTAALKAACVPYNNEAPDAILCCAGSSKPGFFVEMTEDDLKNGMNMAYWVQAWTAHAAVKLMVSQQKKGKIAFVSSVAGLASFVGYASYAPGKTALRGLAETLQSELLLYDIDIHIYFPPTILSPGYEEELKTKPQVQKEIEEDDSPITAEQAANAFLTGITKGHAQITGDLIGNLFRASTRGSSPKNNWILDGIYDFIAFIAVPIWRSSVDKRVLTHRKPHKEHLRSNGLIL